MYYQTSNLGVGGSNPSERANDLVDVTHFFAVAQPSCFQELAAWKQGGSKAPSGERQSASPLQSHQPPRCTARELTLHGANDQFQRLHGQSPVALVEADLNSALPRRSGSLQTGSLPSDT